MWCYTILRREFIYIGSRKTILKKINPNHIKYFFMEFCKRKHYVNKYHELYDLRLMKAFASSSSIVINDLTQYLEVLQGVKTSKDNLLN